MTVFPVKYVYDNDRALDAFVFSTPDNCHRSQLMKTKLYRKRGVSACRNGEKPLGILSWADIVNTLCIACLFPQLMPCYYLAVTREFPLLQRRIRASKDHLADSTSFQSSQGQRGKPRFLSHHPFFASRSTSIYHIEAIRILPEAMHPREAKSRKPMTRLTKPSWHSFWFCPDSLFLKRITLLKGQYLDMQGSPSEFITFCTCYKAGTSLNQCSDV